MSEESYKEEDEDVMSVDDYVNVIENNPPEVAASLLINERDSLVKFGVEMVTSLIELRFQNTENKSFEELQEDAKLVGDFLQKFKS
jgi:hypothetical protein